MRRLLLITVLLFTSVRAFSQSPILLLSTQTLDASDLPLDSVLFQYGNKNELTGSLRKIFSGTEQKWKDYWKKINAYDLNGRMTSEIIYIPLNNEWVEWKKTEYEYDQADRLTKELLFNWESGSWVKKETIDNFYNIDNGLLDSSHIVQFDAGGNPTPFERHLLTYDGEGKLTLDHADKWDKSIDAYVPLSQDKYNYNPEGKLLREDHDSWLGYWYASHFFYYYYTSYGEISERVRYVSSTNQINDTRYYSYNKDENTNAVSNLSSGHINVYPNPFADKLTLDLRNGNYNVSITDLSGRTVIALEGISGIRTINTETFTGGVYYYRITGKNGVVHAGKLISQ